MVYSHMVYFTWTFIEIGHSHSHSCVIPVWHAKQESDSNDRAWRSLTKLDPLCAMKLILATMANVSTNFSYRCNSNVSATLGSNFAIATWNFNGVQNNTWNAYILRILSIIKKLTYKLKSSGYFQTLYQ